MRLLYLTAETWPTYRADVAVLFGKYLPRHGIQSDLVTGRSPGYPDAVVWGGGDAYLCDVSGGQAKRHIRTFLHGIRHLFTADPKRYAAIQVRDLPVLAAFALLAARLKGLPFYYWMSYPMPEGQIVYARERGLTQGLMKFLFPWVRGRVGRILLYRFVLPMANHIFVQSERMKQTMAERGVQAAKMTPVPMGVDQEVMQIEDIPPSEDPRLDGRRALVYLGTLDKVRQIEALFGMLALVRREVPEALLALVGDTEDEMHRRWLMRQADKAGVSEDVIWTGWLPMREGWRYVRAAEVGLSPIPRGPLLDGSSPTKVPEYLALGVPAVCNGNPDQNAAIEQSGAGYCVPYSSSSFADAALKILRLDRASRNTMAESGKRWANETRSYSPLSAMLAATYHNLLRSTREKQ